MQLPIVMPWLGGGTGRLRRWLVQPGEQVEAGTPLLELEAGQVVYAVVAPVPGQLAQVLVTAGQAVDHRTVIAWFEDGSNVPAPPQPPPGLPLVMPPRALDPAPAAEGIVPPVPPPDVETGVAWGSPFAPSVPGGYLSSAYKPPNVQVVPYTNLRVSMAKHLRLSRHVAVPVTAFAEADMSRLLELRDAHKEAFARREGVPLGLLPFFAAATARALRAVPVLNAMQGPDGLIVIKPIHVGFVVRVTGGVRLPVLRDTDTKSIAELAREIHDLSERARADRLWWHEEREGTFLITSPGRGGPLFATPVMSYPNVGILGFETITPRPVAVGKRVEVRPAMFLSLSFDHQVIDGGEAGEFLQAVKSCLEQADFEI